MDTDIVWQKINKVLENPRMLSAREFRAVLNEVECEAAVNPAVSILHYITLYIAFDAFSHRSLISFMGAYIPKAQYKRHEALLILLLASQSHFHYTCSVDNLIKIFGR